MKFASKLIHGGQVHLCRTQVSIMFRVLYWKSKIYKAVLKHLPNYYCTVYWGTERNKEIQK